MKYTHVNYHLFVCPALMTVTLVTSASKLRIKTPLKETIVKGKPIMLRIFLCCTTCFTSIFALIFTLTIPSFLDAAQTNLPPNIVLIISDDQHYSDYRFMGHPVVETPNLDRLASQGLVYTLGYVPASLCNASLSSLITGQFPHRHGITSNDPPNPSKMKPKDFFQSEDFRDGRVIMASMMQNSPTLPKILGEHGYLSFQTGKWWPGNFASGGFTHGMSKGGRHGDDGLVIGRETMQPIYEFFDLAAKENKPFFLWYAPMLPHDPHNPAQHLIDKYAQKTDSLFQAKYWGNVERFDTTCGELLNELDRRGLSENTIVVYVCDNGWIQDQQSPRFAPKSKLSPYNGGLRTPIMIRWPDKIAPKIDTTHLVSSVDIAPTLLTAVGITPPTEMQGINFLDADAVDARKEIYGECYTHDFIDLNNPASNLQYLWTIRDNWKLIIPVNQKTAVPELYNLRDDPDETNNVAQKYPEIVNELTKKLELFYPKIP
ncbi:MAG: sulfatase family protein [Thermoguttaceae bacterium]